MFYEIRKMLIHQKGAYLILFYFLLSLAGLFLLDAPVSPDMERNRESYEHYLRQVEGKCTAETDAFLAAEAERIAAANSTIQRLHNDYYDGKLAEEDFHDLVAGAEAAVRHEKGFGLVYEQYNAIRENPENRWFLYTNGWDGLLSHDRLDLSFALLLLLLTAPVFCQEYESGMDALMLTERKGARRHALCKTGLVVLTVVALCLADSGMRRLFFGFKYGLPHGGYPLQSLSYFATSTREATLMGAFLEISAGKLFGSLSFAMLILFAAVCVKKYALTLFVGSAAVLLPYYGMRLPSTKYLLPGPLGFMVSSGFFRGSEYRYDAGTKEKLMVFREISGAARGFVFAVTLCLALVMAVVILKKHTNIWCIKRRRRNIKPASLFLLLPMVVFFFAGCAASDIRQPRPIFNMAQGDTFENDAYRFFFEESGTQGPVLMLEDKAAGEVRELARSPMRALGTLLESLCGTSDFVYYMKIDFDEARFFAGFDYFSIVELNTRDFSERIVFEKCLNENRDTFLGIGQIEGRAVEPFLFPQAFFLDDKHFYLVGDGKVNQIDRNTGKAEVVLEVPVLKSLAFDGEGIYYINAKSELMRYDVHTGEESKFNDIVAGAFLLTDDELIFMNRLDQSRIYVMDRKNGGLEKLTDEPALQFSLNGETVVYTSSIDLLEHQVKIN